MRPSRLRADNWIRGAGSRHTTQISHTSIRKFYIHRVEDHRDNWMLMLVKGVVISVVMRAIMTVDIIGVSVNSEHAPAGCKLLHETLQWLRDAINVNGPVTGRTVANGNESPSRYSTIDSQSAQICDSVTRLKLNPTDIICVFENLTMTTMNKCMAV